MRVSEILAIKGKVLYTVAPNQGLAGAVATMVEQDIGSLVVFEQGHMVGMLTFREVLKAVHAGNYAGVTVADAMIRDPLAAGPETEIDELRRMMVDRHQRYLPVMDGTTLMGVVSFHDVAKAVLDEQSFENKMLKNYIRNWPEDAEEA